jgi:hypothetical protein
MPSETFTISTASDSFKSGLTELPTLAWLPWVASRREWPNESTAEPHAMPPTHRSAISRGVTADAKGGCAPETPTKTRRGVRTLPLPADALVSLRAQRDAQAALFGFKQVRTGWLAVDEAGEPYRSRAV